MYKVQMQFKELIDYLLKHKKRGNSAQSALASEQLDI